MRELVPEDFNTPISLSDDEKEGLRICESAARYLKKDVKRLEAEREAMTNSQVPEELHRNIFSILSAINIILHACGRAKMKRDIMEIVKESEGMFDLPTEAQLEDLYETIQLFWKTDIIKGRSQINALILERLLLITYENQTEAFARNARNN